MDIETSAPIKNLILFAGNGYMWLAHSIATIEKTQMSFILSTSVSLLTGFYVVLQILAWFGFKWNKRKRKGKDDTFYDKFSKN
jgi:hypothetical protein